jgi:hypothetical protein
MARITANPAVHSVYNEFDKHGLLLGLPRMSSERNWEYKWRLLDVFVHRASSTYLGLIHGITRELGLEIYDAISVVPVVDGNGDPLVSMPAVVFEETKCTLYNDYSDDDVLAEFDRFDSASGVWTVQELVDEINATSYYTATILDDTDPTSRSMTIFNQASVGLVESEDITGKGARIKLEYDTVVPGTVSVYSSNLTEKVSAEVDLVGKGKYYIDTDNGILLTTSLPAPGSRIRYQYRDDNFIAQASPIILHNLQSDDFKNKMFEQTSEGDRALPTALGAYIINELLSVFSTSWGK